MPPKRESKKGKQASVEPEYSEDKLVGEGFSGEPGGEVVSVPGSSGLEASPFIPGFSAQQVNSLATLFQGMLSKECDQRFDRFAAELDRRFEQLTRIQFDPISTIQQSQQSRSQQQQQQSNRLGQQQMKPFKARAHLVDPDGYYEEEELDDQEHAE